MTPSAGKHDTIKIRRYRSWWRASYSVPHASGMTRTEAIAHLLLRLRKDVEVVEIRVEPVKREIPC